MALSRWERKERLPHGVQGEIAAELCAEGTKCDSSDVSRVLHDRASALNPEKVRKIQVAIAKRLRPRVSVAEAFGLEESVAA
ncbi:MAG: hypothetical protein M3P26_15765 [Gemmatimonadota bacterium]|nr:hypothetical protein [Gemmatimonadota bacterium]